MTSNPPVPSLLYGEVEGDLRGTVRDLLRDRSGWMDVLARTESDEPYDDALWAAVAGELGLAGLLIPEERGGEGATAREVAVVLEELGRGIAPAPYVASAVVATGALLACGAETPADKVLSRLSSGEAVASLAVPATTAPEGPHPGAVAARRDGDQLALSGTVTSVLAGDRADVFVVPAALDGAPYLVVVDSADGGVTRSRATSLDLTRPVADVTFDGATGRVVAEPGRAEGPCRYGLRVGAALLASEQLGVAEQCLETTVEYLQTRRQFGRSLGSFQALKHRVADLWTEVNQARSAARYAAACAAEGSEDLPVAAALAQAHCGEVAVHVAEECVQLHGGIGFTWEHSAHLYLKRAMGSAMLLGAADQHRRALAELVDLPAA